MRKCVKCGVKIAYKSYVGLGEYLNVCHECATPIIKSKLPQMKEQYGSVMDDVKNDYVMSIIESKEGLVNLYQNNTDFHKSINSLITGDNLMNVIYIFAELSQSIDNLFQKNIELMKMQPPPKIIVTTKENVDRVMAQYDNKPNPAVEKFINNFLEDKNETAKGD